MRQTVGNGKFLVWADHPGSPDHSGSHRVDGGHRSQISGHAGGGWLPREMGGLEGQGELGWQRGPEGRRLWVDPSSSWVCVDVLMDRYRVGRTGTLRGEFRENPSNQAVLPCLACISDIVIG